jgi:hypothetical protein
MATEKPKKENAALKALSYTLMGLGSGGSGVDFLGNYLKHKAAQEAPPSEFDQYMSMLRSERGSVPAENAIGGNIAMDPMQQERFRMGAGIRPDIYDRGATMGLKQSNQDKLIQESQAKIAERKVTDPMDIEKKKAESVVKWNEEDAERKIKFDVLDPKLSQYMEMGGRAYQELQDVAKEYGVNLKYDKGGIEAVKAKLTKNVALATKSAPLMQALENLRPELGTEMMRQLGAFRSGEMAKRFEDTIAQFSGDIREDIVNMQSSIVKNMANTVLIDDKGNPVSSEEKKRRMEAGEANLIRTYNKMYRGMGLMEKPYTAKRSFEWLAENSNFNEKENTLIDEAVRDNPKSDRNKIIARLIEIGYL